MIAVACVAVLVMVAASLAQFVAWSAPC